jgi:hypothetical protein
MVGASGEAALSPQEQREYGRLRKWLEAKAKRDRQTL